MLTHRSRPFVLAISLGAAALAACGGRDAVEVEGDQTLPTAEELERQRLDGGWREVVTLDSAVIADSARSPEQWNQIAPDVVNRAPQYLPLSGDVAGPSVLRVQILLDRALFSPGAIDGRWGQNTEKALYWLQRRERLPATARVDSATFARLAALAGAPRSLVRRHTLTDADVAGPFLELPPSDSVYARAELPCTCYESLSEKLSELFHVTPEILRQLNPGVALDRLRRGESLWVPDIRPPARIDTTATRVATTDAPAVARLVVSDRGRYLHALDAEGRLLYHFPSTLGSSYEPSPDGAFTVERIAYDPDWHFQPRLLARVDDWRRETVVPGGPNNAVGSVWMALSKPHYGIHGTSAPETIGYASSAGCVRLTNWDALFLSTQIAPGVPVEFRDRSDVAPGA